jgi:DNA primase
MTAIDEIKARLDIVDLVSETVKLRRSGRSYTGFCPFHTNTKTPAFAVFPDSGTWRCFGECNEGGDIFKFVMKKEGWEFVEALRYLADRAGVVLEPLTPEKKAEEDQYDRLRELLEGAVKLFQYHLLETPAGQPALDFLTRRGVTPETMRTFELGYAPPGYETVLAHFTAHGWGSEDLADVGLANKRDEGGYYDKFRNRVMFPIRDAAGRMTGFGARILDPNDIPKFLNSPQTALFDKSHLLYGLNLARKHIREQNQSVIVEGYLDVILLHQAGFSNAVSPMGTALNEDQFRLLNKLSHRILLALDADAAGEKATLRGLDLARNALERETEMAFDAHGLLRHEARLQADLRVTVLPPGMDPDEVVLRDPEEWEQIVASARPIVVHVMETLAKGQDLNDAKVKAAIAAQVTPLIEDMPSAIERDTYRQQLARLLKVDEQTLLGSQKVVQRSRRRTERVEDPARQGAAPRLDKGIDQRVQSLENHCITLLLNRPDGVYELNRELKTFNLEELSPDDFVSVESQTICRLLVQGLDQDEHDIHPFIKLHLPEGLEERYARLLQGEILDEHASNPQRVQQDLMRTLVAIRLLNINSTLGQLKFLQEDPEISAEEKGELSKRILKLTIERGKLDRVTTKATY